MREHGIIAAPATVLGQALLLVLCLQAGGCATRPVRFEYPLGEPIAPIDKVPPEVSLIVLPSDMLRFPDESYMLSGVYVIPLVPFGPFWASVPEQSKMAKYSGNLNYEIPRAIATHLREAGIAKNVSFADSMAQPADYYVSVDLLDTTFEGKILSYGLSFAALPAWLLGAPVLHHRWSIAYDLELFDSSGNLVARTSAHENRSRWSAMYYNTEPPIQDLSHALRSSIEEVIDSGFFEAVESPESLIGRDDS